MSANSACRYICERSNECPWWKYCRVAYIHSLLNSCLLEHVLFITAWIWANALHALGKWMKSTLEELGWELFFKYIRQLCKIPRTKHTAISCTLPSGRSVGVNYPPDNI